MAKLQEETTASPNILKHLPYLNCLSQSLTFKLEQGMSAQAQAGYKSMMQLPIPRTILVWNAGPVSDRNWYVCKSDPGDIPDVLHNLTEAEGMQHHH